MKKILFSAAAGMLLAGTMILPASAAMFSPTNYSLFGTAQYVSPGESSNRAVELTSASTTYGGIDYGFPGGLTFAGITNLSTDFLFTAGSCGGGSPRFSIGVTNGTSSGNIFVYLGPAPNYTGCAANTWLSSGELVGTSTVDTSQLPGGTFYDTWAHAESAYGLYTVTDLALVVDGGWMFPAQTADIDNTTINSTTYTYEVPSPTTLGQCKNGGWMNLADANGHLFRNQGDCVSYVATGGKNTAAGR
ncbi:MAG: hypothetical protein KGJ13_02920 [Patescibacteria group bacterium]|nr:hypothetical protein [Patescibacteria group bacterium]